MLGDGLGDAELELGNALTGDGGDLEEGEFAAFGHGAKLLELVGIGDIGLGRDQDRVGLSGERRVKALELVGDNLEVVDGVGPAGAVGDIDQVDDDAGALDVLEELDAEAGAEVGAFDEAGKVGDGEGLLGVGEVADLDDAEVGLEGGEGVVGDLGFGGGEARDEGGFADVGVADEAGVGQQTQLEAVVALFAGAAELVLARGLVGAGGEVLVAASSASAAGDDDGLVGTGEVVDELAGLVVVEEGTDGDFEGGVLAGVAGAVGAEAVASALRLCAQG